MRPFNVIESYGESQSLLHIFLTLYNNGCLLLLLSQTLHNFMALTRLPLYLPSTQPFFQLVGPAPLPQLWPNLFYFTHKVFFLYILNFIMLAILKTIIKLCIKSQYT